VRALVVDDFVYNLRILRVIFQSAGYEVETAADGQAALDAVRARRPDFVLTDILMPRLDGFQLCRAIKTDPALSGVPLVFYTGSYVEPADREFGMGLGAAAYLLKPMEPKDLLAAVLRRWDRKSRPSSPTPTSARLSPPRTPTALRRSCRKK
jgi:CheY-like chemotaxis protein